jgi:outer membrane receptor protein involved in Fe transport
MVFHELLSHLHVRGLYREHVDLNGKRAARDSAALRCGVCVAVLWATATAAQETGSRPVDAALGGADQLQEIVVTATPTSGGLKKLDAAFSITSLSQEAIKEGNPVDSADILRMSPGVYVESSSGQTGANVEVSGFPSSGSSPYVTMELNGASLFPMSGQSFLNGPTFFRLDDTIQRVELVQGGPGVLYGNGQSGLTANYILKRGTDTPAGDIGFTYGSEGSERVDAFVSGVLDKGAELYGSIGGFWRRSDGVRNPQFAADDGGQLTATLAKDWDNGSLLAYGRYLNDKNQYVTDTPLLNPAMGSFAAYPGFSPLTGTMGSKADQFEVLLTTPCTGAGCVPGGIRVNLADGRSVNVGVVGEEFHWDFGNGLQLLDDANFSTGTITSTAMFSTGLNPEPLSTFIASGEAANNLPGTLAANASYTNTGAAAPLSQNVLTQQLRFMRETFHSGSNEFHLSKELIPGNTLTFGNYTAVFRLKQESIEGSLILLTAQSNPTPIAVNLTNGVNTWQLSSSSGFTNSVSSPEVYTGTGYDTAFFLSDSWKLGDFLFDAGVREEHEQIKTYLQNTASGSLTGNPYQLYNTSAAYFVPGTTTTSYSKTAAAWTVGLNYEFNPNMSAYVRANAGPQFAAFSDIRTGNVGPVERAQNYEVGFKYQSPVVYADISAYNRIFTGVPFSNLVSYNGLTENVSYDYGSKTKGLEYQVSLRPFTSKPWDGFTLSMSGDYAVGKYDNSSDCVTFNGIVNQTVCNPSYGLDGNLLARQPTFQTRVTPSYNVPTDWGFVKAWVTYEYIGQHYGDQHEQQDLGTYYDLSFGVTGGVGQYWEWSVLGTNATNQIGLTEGNARILTGSATSGGTILARSIEGREVSLQLKCKF